MADEWIQSEPQEPSDNTTEDDSEKKEGFKPKEFFQTLETIAEAQAEYVVAADRLSIEHGQTIVDGTVERRKLGAYDDDLADRHEELIIELRKKLEVIQAPKNIRDTQYTHAEMLSTAVESKREMCRYMTQVARSRIPDYEKKSPQEQNNIVAEYIFNHLYETEGIKTPPGLQFFETEFGIGFLVPDQEELDNLYYGSKKTVADNENEDVEKKRTSVAGFYTQRDVQMRIADEEDYNTHSIGLTFQLGSIDSEYAVLRGATVKHEIQHVKDYLILEDLGIERYERVQNRELTRRNPRIELLLSPETHRKLKYEILAYNTTDFTKEGTKSPYITLTTSPLYAYKGKIDNYRPPQNPTFYRANAEVRDIIRAKFGKSSVQEERIEENYKRFVRNATSAVAGTRVMYKAHYKDEEMSRQMAIALLGMFPMYDWKRVEKMVEKYSKYDDYRNMVYEPVELPSF